MRLRITADSPAPDDTAQFIGWLRLQVPEGHPLIMATDPAGAAEIESMFRNGHVTEDDVRAGIKDACARGTKQSGKPLDAWRSIIGWVKGAAKERMAAGWSPAIAGGASFGLAGFPADLMNRPARSTGELSLKLRYRLAQIEAENAANAQPNQPRHSEGAVGLDLSRVRVTTVHQANGIRLRNKIAEMRERAEAEAAAPNGAAEPEASAQSRAPARTNPTSDCPPAGLDMSRVRVSTMHQANGLRLRRKMMEMYADCDAEEERHAQQARTPRN